VLKSRRVFNVVCCVKPIRKLANDVTEKECTLAGRFGIWNHT